MGLSKVKDSISGFSCFICWYANKKNLFVLWISITGIQQKKVNLSYIWAMYYKISKLKDNSETQEFIDSAKNVQQERRSKYTI